MKMASYSPHPPVYLQQLSNIPGPSRRTLPLHSNLHNFRHVGVNGTQSTSQTLFPNAKKKELFDLILEENTCPRDFLNILFLEALFIRDLLRILLE